MPKKTAADKPVTAFIPSFPFLLFGKLALLELRVQLVKVPDKALLGGMRMASLRHSGSNSMPVSFVIKFAPHEHLDSVGPQETKSPVSTSMQKVTK